MKYIVAATLAVLSASPAFAGGGSRAASLIGTVVAPITTAVSALNVNALNNVSVLNGNKVSVAANAPITVKNNSILSGILGGGSHGCGCN
jgi:hypothetical protein